MSCCGFFSQGTTLNASYCSLALIGSVIYTTDQNLSKVISSWKDLIAALQYTTLIYSLHLQYRIRIQVCDNLGKRICYKEFYVSTIGNNLCMAARMMVAESNWKVVQSNAEQTLQLFKFETMQVTQKIAKLNLHLVCPCVNSNKQQPTSKVDVVHTRKHNLP